MSKLPDETLKSALNALIVIEQAGQPTIEQLKALQLTVWAWMDGPETFNTSQLFKQGKAIKLESKHKTEAIETALAIYKHKEQRRTSENKAIENANLKPRERTRRTHMKIAKVQANMNEAKAKRLSSVIAEVRKVLHKKP